MKPLSCVALLCLFLHGASAWAGGRPSVPLDKVLSTHGLGLSCDSHIARDRERMELVSNAQRISVSPSSVLSLDQGPVARVRTVGRVQGLTVEAIDVPVVTEGKFSGTSESYDTGTGARIRYSTYALRVGQSFKVTAARIERQLPQHLRITENAEGPDPQVSGRKLRFSSTTPIASRKPNEIVDLLVAPVGTKAVVQVTCVLSKE